MGHRIILFRGMNTGGVRAPVGEQRAMAEKMGLKNPRTLAASGNLVVESGAATAALETDIEAAMQATFGLKIAAMARTPRQWADLIAANPFKAEAQAAPSRLLVMVMKDGVKAGGLAGLRTFATEDEKVEAVTVGGGDALYFWHPEGLGQSKMAEKALPRLIGMGTGRNWNTVLKLAEMVGLEVKA
jgi:uncharacterized protein (DUF1697 family)